MVSIAGTDPLRDSPHPAPTRSPIPQPLPAAGAPWARPRPHSRERERVPCTARPVAPRRSLAGCRGRHVPGHGSGRASSPSASAAGRLPSTAGSTLPALPSASAAPLPPLPPAPALTVGTASQDGPEPAPWRSLRSPQPHALRWLRSRAGTASGRPGPFADARCPVSPAAHLGTACGSMGSLRDAP